LRSITPLAANACLIGLCSCFFSAAANAQSSKADWASPRLANFDAVTDNPEPFTGKAFVVNASICEVRISDKGKRARAIQVRPAAFGMREITGSLPIVFDDWYRARAGTADGRAQIRDMAQHGFMCDALLSTPPQDLLVTVGQFSDTFQPYLGLVDMMEPGTRAARSPAYPSPSARPAPQSLPLPLPSVKPRSKSAALAKTESLVEFSPYYRARTLSVRAEKGAVMAAIASALAGLKEDIAINDQASGVIVTRHKKRLLAGVRHQIAVAVEPGAGGKSVISLKIVHSQAGGAAGYEPVRDERWVERNDRPILEAVTKALANAGVPVESNAWQFD
jgi:hypothetical protein